MGIIPHWIRCKMRSGPLAVWRTPATDVSLVKWARLDHVQELHPDLVSCGLGIGERIRGGC